MAYKPFPTIPVYAVSGLPSAATYTNAMVIISDALTAGLGITAVGGGVVRLLATSNGTNWVTSALA